MTAKQLNSLEQFQKYVVEFYSFRDINDVSLDIESHYSVADYGLFISAFGYEVEHTFFENNYQGDAYAIVRNGEQIGLLIFGFGSCSGCDELQACSTWGDLYNLAQKLDGNIKWFDTYDDMKRYIVSGNAKNEYWYYIDDEFVSEMIDYLEAKLGEAKMNNPKQFFYSSTEYERQQEKLRNMDEDRYHFFANVDRTLSPPIRLPFAFDGNERMFASCIKDRDSYEYTYEHLFDEGIYTYKFELTLGVGYTFKHVEVSYMDEYERFFIFESDKLSDLGEAQRAYIEAVRKAREG